MRRIFRTQLSAKLSTERKADKRYLFADVGYEIRKLFYCCFGIENLICGISVAHDMRNNKMIFFGKRILPAEAVDKVCPVQKDDCLIVLFAVFITVHIFPSVIFLVAVIIARVRGIVKQQKHRIYLNV